MSDETPPGVGRPDFINDNPPTGFGVVARPLSLLERIFDRGEVRKGIFLYLDALGSASNGDNLYNLVERVWK